MAGKLCDPLTMQHVPYFSASVKRLSHIKRHYVKCLLPLLLGNYVGLPLTDEHLFDVELVDSIIAKLNCSKAAGLDNITVEHLQHSHHARSCNVFVVLRCVRNCLTIIIIIIIIMF